MYENHNIKICQPPWRNWLARSAVNRKVGGSSPPGGDYLILSELSFYVSNKDQNILLQM